MGYFTVNMMSAQMMFNHLKTCKCKPSYCDLLGCYIPSKYCHNFNLRNFGSPTPLPFWFNIFSFTLMSGNFSYKVPKAYM